MSAIPKTRSLNLETNKPITVIGDGWAALGAVGFLGTMGLPIRWISGTGTRILPPLPAFDFQNGTPVWSNLIFKLQIQSGDIEQGSFLREFRNKAFREPAWLKAPTPEFRRDVRDELCWGPERRFVSLFEGRFRNMTLWEVEEEIRKQLVPEKFPNILKTSGVPVASFKTTEGAVSSLVLTSGEEFECTQVIYAEPWHTVASVDGLPKPLSFIRNREAVGVLQVLFTHSSPIGTSLSEGFFIPLHKEAGEEIERSVWGYFSTDGSRSLWTVFLTEEETEDNHAIGKKLRRLKTALNKALSGTIGCEQGDKEFVSTISAEQVRFEESVVFTNGDPINKPLTLPGLAGIHFLTDGYGPMHAMNQVAVLLGVEELDTKTEHMGLEHPVEC